MFLLYLFGLKMIASLIYIQDSLEMCFDTEWMTPEWFWECLIGWTLSVLT